MTLTKKAFSFIAFSLIVSGFLEAKKFNMTLSSKNASRKAQPKPAKKKNSPVDTHAQNKKTSERPTITVVPQGQKTTIPVTVVNTQDKKTKKRHVIKKALIPTVIQNRPTAAVSTGNENKLPNPKGQDIVSSPAHNPELLKALIPTAIQNRPTAAVSTGDENKLPNPKGQDIVSSPAHNPELLVEISQDGQKRVARLLPRIRAYNTEKDSVVPIESSQVALEPTQSAALEEPKEVITPIPHSERNSITQADFLDIQGMATRSRKLNKAGTYTLEEDITFAPTTEYTAALEVLANDVTIDLNGHSITQTNKTTGTIGIRIGEAVDYHNPAKTVYRNITLRDGGLLNFTGSGISAMNTAQFFGLGAFESLTFKDIAIIDCGSNPSYAFASGIDLDSFARYEYKPKQTDIAYRDILIDGCFIKRSKGTASINVYPGVNVRVINSDIDEPLPHPRRGV